MIYVTFEQDQHESLEEWGRRVLEQVKGNLPSGKSVTRAYAEDNDGQRALYYELDGRCHRVDLLRNGTVLKVGRRTVRLHWRSDLCDRYIVNRHLGLSP